MKYIGVVFYLFYTISISKAQTSIASVSVNNIELAPETTSSIPLLLFNNDSTAVNYQITIENNNSQIEILNSKKIITLFAKEKKTTLFPIKIGKECPSGKYQIMINILNMQRQKTQKITVDIVVSSVESLSLLPIDGNEFVKAGDNISAKFIIKNTGNIEQTIDLFSHQGKIEQDTRLILKPQEEQTIVVSKLTSDNESYLSQQIIDLNASRNKDNVILQSAYNSTNIIPVNPPQLDAYKRIPLHFSLSYLRMRYQHQSAQGWQGELHTKGMLSEKLNDWFELRMMTKNPIQYNSYGQYEEYFARYTNEKINLHIGDKVYSSSILTEYARYGRGIEFRYNINRRFSIGGYYNKPRFFKDIADEFNVNTKIELSKKNKITLGYLQKNTNSDSLYQFSESKRTAQLPYFVYQTNMIKNTSIETEYSVSKFGKSKGSGFRIEAHGSYNKLYTNLNFIYTSPNYSGYFQNSTIFNASVSYLLSRKTTILANHYQDARNINRDTLLLAAPLQNYSQIGVNYRFSSTGNVNVMSGYIKNEDRMPLNIFKYNEFFFRLSIGQRLGDFQITYDNQYGYTNNLLTQLNGKSNFNQLSIGFSKFNTFVNIFGSLSNSSRYSQEDTKYINYGGRISKIFFKHSTLNLFYQSNYTPEEYFKDRSQFEVALRQELISNHAIELNGRYMMQRGQLGNKDFIFSFKYIVQLNIPIRKIADYSTLKGKISNENNENLSGVRVQLGNKVAITDSDGNYVFKNILPGDYYLDIDKGSLSIDAISNEKLPKAITIENKKENIQNFNITKAAKITGQVKIIESYNHLAVNNTTAKNLPEHLFIEINNGVQVIRKICSVKDGFDFTQLKPGTWNVKIYTNSLNNNLKLSKESFEFDLQPGEIKDITVEIKHVQKEIRYQNEAIKVTYKDVK